MDTMASQITSLTIVYSNVYSRRRSKKISKLRVTGLCEANSPVTGEFPTQRASNGENVSIWWHHHGPRFMTPMASLTWLSLNKLTSQQTIFSLSLLNTRDPFTKLTWFNSLTPGKFEWNLINVIFKWILVTDSWDISCEIALIWMSLDFTDDQSTLVQVMAWWLQATIKPLPELMLTHIFAVIWCH